MKEYNVYNFFNFFCPGSLALIGAYGGVLSLYFAMEQSFVLFTSFNHIKVIKFIPSKPLTMLYSWLF
ncbi:unnamed protein product [Sphagnum balticum]